MPRKKKQPAFLLYAQDYLRGTEDMTFAEQGKYMRILCYMHEKGALEMTYMRKILHYKKVPDVIMEKLDQTEDGKWIHHRSFCVLSADRQQTGRKSAEISQKYRRNIAERIEDNSTDIQAVVDSESEESLTRARVARFDNDNDNKYSTSKKGSKRRSKRGSIVKKNTTKVNQELERVVDDLLDYFNQATGRRYKKEVKANRLGIMARLKEQEDHDPQILYDVIDLKTHEWLDDPEMEQYLNPITIFRPSNFSKYEQYIFTLKARGATLESVPKRNAPKDSQRYSELHQKIFGGSQ